MTLTRAAAWPSRAVRFCRKKTGNTVFVSELHLPDARCFDQWTEAYRQALAYIDRRLAAVCDQVIEVAYGHIYEYRGG